MSSLTILPVSSSVIRTVHAKDWKAGLEAKYYFSELLGDAFTSIGFVYVAGFEEYAYLLDNVRRLASKVFALPDSVKFRYETPHNGRQTGYTRKGIERAMGSGSEDDKEFWQVMRRYAKNAVLPIGAAHTPFPAEVPEFKDACYALFDHLEVVALMIAAAMELAWGLRIGSLVELLKKGNSVQRILHYPPSYRDQEGYRAAPHEDIGFLTVLPIVSGLMVKDRNGAWYRETSLPGMYTINVGDSLSMYLKAHYGRNVPSTTHGVLAPAGQSESRFSMPFFGHPPPDVFIDKTRTAHDVLEERKRAIGVTAHA